MATLEVVHSFASVSQLRPARHQLPVREQRTALLHAHLQQTEVDRLIGVADGQSLSELEHVLETCFGLQGAHPTTFLLGEQRLPKDACVHTFLHGGDEAVEFRWGLWRIEVKCVETYPRDAATPEAVCIGGDGNGLDGSAFSTGKINVALSGAVVDQVLAAAHPEVRALVEGTEMWDFIPLLHALDLRTQDAHEGFGLPVEKDHTARLAWWALLLGLVCMNEFSEHVAVSTMEQATGQKGWTFAELLAACPESVAHLEELGGVGQRLLSPVERIALYRDLLRGQ
ncbi:hypothetical protein NQ015_07775 [Corynebacterium sp. 153RC1]|uniref:hypothetical protein n=1 Tax=unclassified Corynebacterium TaxID=2624378 RepID=UPI00211C1AC6|nr:MULTISPECIES: hypothetical protein [unclassified Corynebacterium]MCQ9352847.1 hypothetical protein [Corynebacterium sp. 209RC1]MCQ9355239.1 hypothetical protein [Corynebacterium sp. 1222RC1]MCQ9357426.1 hypothetical protein [Corynebacterium sp. 122RC1]MCQ9359646.1 hypothetical protein [Corynebacterium sp. 142RC1]MCQ9361660.1 hypothetical protein [Corynebacterium sp. 153RC1]